MTAPKRKPLRMGDRVRVRLDDGKRYVGAVERRMPFGNVMINLAASLTAPVLHAIVHPKQCTRLVKPKRAAREWEGHWSEQYMSDGSPRMIFVVAAEETSLPRVGELMHLREVLPRRKGGA